jgi:hypothetical protein
MWFEAGEYAWPGVNFLLHCGGIALLIGALTLAYNVHRSWSAPS